MMSPHVDYVVARILKSFASLGRDLTEASTLKKLFCAVIVIKSNLEFASLVWNLFHNVPFEKLDSVQRRLLKNLSLKLDDFYSSVGISQDDLLDTQ